MVSVMFYPCMFVCELFGFYEEPYQPPASPHDWPAQKTLIGLHCQLFYHVDTYVRFLNICALCVDIPVLKLM